METFTGSFWLDVSRIVGIDVILSGDNAVLIALACMSLPPKQQKIGITLGVVAALVLRIVFAAAVSWLLLVPYLKVVGGLALIYIAIKLVLGEEDAEDDKKGAPTLFQAVKMIAVADVMMSFDNVMAIAAAAHGHALLFVIGLLLSMPLMIFGASAVSYAIKKFHFLIWAGGAILGWVAGEMIATDPSVDALIHGVVPTAVGLAHYGAAAFGALVVVIVGLILCRNPKGEVAHGTAS